MTDYFVGKEQGEKNELQSNLKRIDEIIIMLDNQNESTNLETIIQEEELNLFKNAVINWSLNRKLNSM